MSSQNINFKNKQPKYKFHFRAADVWLIMIDYAFRPGGYGDFDYRVLLKDQLCTAYLTNKGVRQAYQFGQQLFNKKYADDILRKLILFNKELINIKKFTHVKINRRNALQEWQKCEKFFIKFGQFYRYCEQPMLTALEERVLKASKNNQDLVNIFSSSENLKSHNFSKKDVEIVNILIDLGKIKLKIHEKFGDIYKLAYRIFVFISRKYALSLNQVLVLRGEEIKKALSGVEPNVNVLNMRLKGVVFLPPLKGRKWRCLTGKNYEDWKKRLEPESKGIIKGDPVFPGKVKGKVKIHLSTYKSAKIKKGIILVSGMTNPQIIAQLKNAAAIVTDEGGLTCHAAIISRELKIPCIVGTGNATQTLKDGDLVEVDANKGMVRILSRKKV